MDIKEITQEEFSEKCHVSVDDYISNPVKIFCYGNHDGYVVNGKDHRGNWLALWEGGEHYTTSFIKAQAELKKHL